MGMKGKGSIFAIIGAMIASVYGNPHTPSPVKEMEARSLSKMQQAALGVSFHPSPGTNQRKNRKQWRQNPHTRPRVNRS